MNTNLTLGFPSLNRLDLAVGMVTSACRGTRPPNLVVMIDNGGQTTRGGFVNPDHTVPVELDYPGTNLGVARSWNRLIARHLKRPEDRLLICGDDVTFHADTIASLEQTMEQTGADFVFPDPSRSTMHQMFSCFMVRKELFDKVGRFDENFYPAYFEDNDFHRRMKLAGAVEAIAPCGYDHVNSGTLKRFTPAQTEQHHANFRRARSYYVSKWGGLPTHETFSTPFGK